VEEQLDAKDKAKIRGVNDKGRLDRRGKGKGKVVPVLS
jgi:hypothetical protein